MGETLEALTCQGTSPKNKTRNQRQRCMILYIPTHFYLLTGTDNFVQTVPFPLLCFLESLHVCPYFHQTDWTLLMYFDILNHLTICKVGPMMSHLRSGLAVSLAEEAARVKKIVDLA